MLHVYTGNGKGKTTCAVGLAVRFAGSGGRVHFFQMLKRGNSSEIKILKNLENIEVSCCENCLHFTYDMDEIEKREVTERHNEMLKNIERLLSGGDRIMIVIDEFFKAYNSSLLDRNLALEIVSETCHNAEIILTGRDAPREFREIADYISEISEVKHPFRKGITAREGIEF